MHPQKREELLKQKYVRTEFQIFNIALNLQATFNMLSVSRV